MSRQVALLHKRLLFILIPALISLAYLGGSASSSSARKDERVVRLNNLTRLCDLSVKIHGDSLKASIQNNNNKAVTAFTLTSQHDPRTVFTLRSEFIFSEGDGDYVIPPGQRYDQEVGTVNVVNSQGDIILTLSNVIYEDGSSEGDLQTIRDTLDSRLGRKIQIMKALPVLDQMVQLPDEEMNAYWNQSARQSLEDALNAPNSDTLLKLNQKFDNESEQFKSGAQVGKDTVLRNFQELKEVQEKQGIRALRDRIVALRHLYMKMINRA